MATRHHFWKPVALLSTQHSPIPPPGLRRIASRICQRYHLEVLVGREDDSRPTPHTWVNGWPGDWLGDWLGGWLEVNRLPDSGYETW